MQKRFLLSMMMMLCSGALRSDVIIQLSRTASALQLTVIRVINYSSFKFLLSLDLFHFFVNIGGKNIIRTTIFSCARGFPVLSETRDGTYS